MGWEDSATLANILNGVCRVVHGPTLAWKVVPAAFIPRVAYGVAVTKVVNAPFIPRVERGEAISKAVYSVSTGRVVRESRTARIQAPHSFTGKVVVGSNIPKVQQITPSARAVRLEGTPKVVK